MEWGTIVVLALVIPVVLFPAVFVLYLVIGGSYAAAKQRVDTVVSRAAHAALFFLVGIFFPILIWVGLGIALNRWIRESAVHQPRTVGKVLASAGISIRWESPAASSLAMALFVKQPMSEIQELLARAGLQGYE